MQDTQDPIDTLLSEALPPSMTRDEFRHTVRAAMDEQRGIYHRLASSRTYQMDLVTAAFGLPGRACVARPWVPLSISPVLWDGKRMLRVYTGQDRQRLHLLRDAIFYWRYKKSWHVRLLDIDRLAKTIFSEFAGGPAHPIERLAVLPRVLRAIRDGTFKVCFLALHQYEEGAPDLMERYTCADQWATGVRIRPHTSRGAVEWFEMSNFREELNEHLRNQIGQWHPQLGALDGVAMERAQQAETIYELSQQTLKQLVNQVHDCWKEIYDSNGDHVERLDEWLRFAEEVGEAIDAGERLPESSEPSEPSEFKPIGEDVHMLSTELDKFCREIGADIPERPDPPRDGSEKELLCPVSDSLPADDGRIRFTNDGLVLFEGKTLNSPKHAPWQYDVFKQLHEQQVKAAGGNGFSEYVSLDEMTMVVFPDEVAGATKETWTHYKQVTSKRINQLKAKLKKKGVSLEIYNSKDAGYKLVYTA